MFICKQHIYWKEKVCLIKIDSMLSFFSSHDLSNLNFDLPSLLCLARLASLSLSSIETAVPARLLNQWIFKCSLKCVDYLLMALWWWLWWWWLFSFFCCWKSCSWSSQRQQMAKWLLGWPLDTEDMSERKLSRSFTFLLKLEVVSLKRKTIAVTICQQHLTFFTYKTVFWCCCCTLVNWRPICAHDASGALVLVSVWLSLAADQFDGKMHTHKHFAHLMKTYLKINFTEKR